MYSIKFTFWEEQWPKNSWFGFASWTGDSRWSRGLGFGKQKNAVCFAQAFSDFALLSCNHFLLVKVLLIQLNGVKSFAVLSKQLGQILTDPLKADRNEAETPNIANPGERKHHRRHSEALTLGFIWRDRDILFHNLARKSYLHCFSCASLQILQTILVCFALLVATPLRLKQNKVLEFPDAPDDLAWTPPTSVICKSTICVLKLNKPSAHPLIPSAVLLNSQANPRQG